MATKTKIAGKQFHGSIDYKKGYGLDKKEIWNGGLKTSKVKKITKKTTVEERTLGYRFYTHFHPYVKHLIKELIEGSVDGLQKSDTDYTSQKLADGSPRPVFYEEFFKDYHPHATLVPETKPGSAKSLYPVKDLDFTSSGGYSVYNWELFFHVPFNLAIQLSKSQRYEEAMKWFHYIFDPADDSPGAAPERFWHVKPFQQTQVKKIEELMLNLSSQADYALFTETVNSINQWKANPFRPHVIARFRQSAFMMKTVMAYLDNLIEWGDSLFLQDTGESINEASQLYIMAANILGPRPQAVPKKGTVKTQTYNSMRTKLDPFSNMLQEIEVELPFNLAPTPSAPSGGTAGSSSIALKSIGSALYFCVPQNNKMLEYWDRVADRLYKIHNSLNMQGVFRQLPLFEPEIDPALLARAAAGGLSISAIVNGLNQPLPLVRFRLLLQKANEICQEVKALGSALLAAIEKQDGETIQLIRAKHEKQILQLTENVKYAQWQEAIKSREGVQQSLKNAVARYKHFETLLGNTNPEVEEQDALDEASMEQQRFRATANEVTPREIGYDFFAEALDAAGLGDLNMLRMNTPEAIAMLLDASSIPLEMAAITMDAISSVLTMVPEFHVRATPMGIGAGATISGQQLGRIVQMMSSATRGGESVLKMFSGLSSTVAGHMRRRQEWEVQSQNAAGEINSVFKQLISAQIREHIAKKEFETHQQNIKNAEELEMFLEGEKVNGFTKTTTQGFYSYLRREVSSLHNKYFKFAYEVARKAERALQHELGNPELSYLQYNYMSGREGLYAGEKLAFDLKRMEIAYFDMNQRELELVKHISIGQVSPSALLQLRLTGKCSVSIPEEVFDIGGCEGHYFRRIKSVAVSMPCVAGPYTSINCTLTMTRSTIRTKSTLLNNEYTMQENDTERFSEAHGTTSIVTSGAQNDSGLFSFNTNDDRYQPFEYAGVISEWQIELADDFRQFDYNTISDVIFHINYTARQGGGLLKTAAVQNLKNMVGTKDNTRMFSLKYDFPTAYHQFITQPADSNGRFLVSIEIKDSHYPYWSQGYVTAIKGIEVHAITGSAVEFVQKNDTTKKFQTTQNSQLTDTVYPGKVNKVFTGTWENIDLPASPKGKLEVLVSSKNVDDIWFMVKW